MKNIILIFLFSISAFGLLAQDHAVPQPPPPAAADNPNAPVFNFMEEAHDFGNVKEGPEAQYDFEFINTGKEPLIIQNCSASCGCTTPDWSREPVLPGKKGKITVKYNTKGRVGAINKTVFVQSNAKRKAPGVDRYELQIRGTVIAENNTDTNIVLNPSVQVYKAPTPPSKKELRKLKKEAKQKKVAN